MLEKQSIIDASGENSNIISSPENNEKIPISIEQIMSEAGFTHEQYQKSINADFWGGESSSTHYESDDGGDRISDYGGEWAKLAHMIDGRGNGKYEISKNIENGLQLLEGQTVKSDNYYGYKYIKPFVTIVKSPLEDMGVSLEIINELKNRYKEQLVNEERRVAEVKIRSEHIPDIENKFKTEVFPIEEVVIDRRGQNHIPEINYKRQDRLSYGEDITPYEFWSSLLSIVGKNGRSTKAYIEYVVTDLEQYQKYDHLKFPVLISENRSALEMSSSQLKKIILAYGEKLNQINQKIEKQFFDKKIEAFINFNRSGLEEKKDSSTNTPFTYVKDRRDHDILKELQEKIDEYKNREFAVCKDELVKEIEELQYKINEDKIINQDHIINSEEIKNNNESTHSLLASEDTKNNVEPPRPASAEDITSLIEKFNKK